MQLMIDTNTDKPEHIRKVAEFLLSEFGDEDYNALPAPHIYEPPADPLPAALVKQVLEAQTAPQPPPPVPEAPATLGDVDVDTDDEGNDQPVPSDVPPPPFGAPSAPTLFDKRGVQWDARIHAQNRSGTPPTKIDGSWKSKRGVDPELIKQLEKVPGNAPEVAAVPAPLAAPVPAPPPPPAPLPAGVSAPTPQTAAPFDFRGLMLKITQLSASNKLPPEAVNAALAGVGLKPEDMGLLIGNAVLIASVNAAIDKATV